ncbi:MAG: hypothetical protein WKG52_10000 [Variovorax sp.]
MRGIGAAKDVCLNINFQKWVALTKAYEEHFLSLQKGDLSVRSEITRISKELRHLDELNAEPAETIQPGIDGTEFTANAGKLRVGAVVVKGKTFVGADGLQFYRGQIKRKGSAVSVLMEVTRHNYAVQSAFGTDALFTLKWVGSVESNSVFKLECRPPGSDLVVRVTGTLLLGH